MYKDPEKYFKNAVGIFQLLVPFVAGNEMGVPERKMIIPDGMLGKMPFEALLTRSDYSPAVSQWPFLVREALLWRAYSLDVWNQLQEQPRVAREYERDFAGFFFSFGRSEGHTVE